METEVVPEVAPVQVGRAGERDRPVVTLRCEQERLEIAAQPAQGPFRVVEQRAPRRLQAQELARRVFRVVGGAVIGVGQRGGVEVGELLLRGAAALDRKSVV